jgi:hypothetical protein
MRPAGACLRIGGSPAAHGLAGGWAGFSVGLWGGAGRHLAVAQELVEWWEDLRQRDIGSQVVLSGVPAGGARTAMAGREQGA